MELTDAFFIGDIPFDIIFITVSKYRLVQELSESSAV